MRKARRGFTLLELILVLAIMAMLMAMVIPEFETMYSDVRVQAGSDRLRGTLAVGRTRAIDDGRPYRFSVKSGTGNYRLAPDSAEFWDGGAAAPNSDESMPEPLIDEGTLPSDIVFEIVGGPRAESGGWTTLVTFLPTGSAADDCTIRLERDGARPIEIQVRALTGSVTARSLRMGEGR